MSSENNPKKLETKHKAIIILIVGVLTVAFAIYFLITNKSFVSFSSNSGSALGDTIGGITAPIIGLLGSILVFYALLEQIKANKIISEQFLEQKKITHRQNFEQTFFNMLNLHNEIVRNISLVSSDINMELYFDKSTLERIEKNGIDHLLTTIHKIGNQADFDDKNEYEHRAFFKVSIERLKEVIYLADKYGGLGKMTKKSKFENKEKGVQLESYFPHIYHTMFHRLDTHLGHYYRNMYRIVKMIDEQTFSEDAETDYGIKYFYTSILRSQLSDYEIQWLFFNGLFDYGEKFKPLIQEYSLLKILRWNEDEVIKKFKPFYADIAFIEIEWEERLNPQTGKKTKVRKKGFERTGFD